MRDVPGAEKRTSLRLPFSVFQICTGAAALTSAGILIFDPRLALLPFVPLFLACLIAPFVPRVSFFLPVLTRGSRTQPIATLTFDDGPDPATTPMLLDLLARHGAPATFFVIGAKAERHPDLVRAILAGGHEIGNHTYDHDVFLMLRGRARLRREIARAQDVLRPFGIRPLVFRPPVGITNPWLSGALADAGMICVCFRRRPADFGNRRIKRLKERVVRNLAAGDILLMHEGVPKPSEGRARAWLAAVEGVLEKMAQKGLRPALLSETIRRPVFEPVPLTSGDPEEPPRGGVPSDGDRSVSMITFWKRKLAGTRWVQRALEKAAIEKDRKEKLTSRFFAGMAVLGLSYILGWPFVSVLGILAARQHRSEIFLIGAPVSYGVSTILLLLGAGLAGKDGLRYLRRLFHRLVARFYARYLAKSGGDR